MLLKWRLSNYEEHLPEVELPVKGRLKELWKPIIQAVAGLKVEKSLRNHLSLLELERLQEKANTLEGRLVKIISELYKGEPLAFQEIWEKLAYDLDGKTDEKKPNQMDTADYGIITKNLVGYRLREVLNGRKTIKRTLEGQVKAYTFDIQKLGRLAKKYAVTKLPSLPRGEEVSTTKTMIKPWNLTMENIAETQEELGKLGNLVNKTVTPDHKPEFKIEDFKAVYWKDGFYTWHPCAVCGYTKLTAYKAETFKGDEAWVCEDCKEAWEKAQQP